MSFIVIEGDNATGKTTLSNCLPYENINTLSWFRYKEAELKKLPLLQKIPAFLDFNLKCGEYGEKNKNVCVLTRYWISTLCAAYADGLYDQETTCRLVQECEQTYPKPVFVIFLRCTESVRMSRISIRRNNNDFSDPILEERNKRYLHISQYIESVLNNSITFATDNCQSNEIAQRIVLRIQQEKENAD